MHKIYCTLVVLVRCMHTGSPLSATWVWVWDAQVWLGKGWTVNLWTCSTSKNHLDWSDLLSEVGGWTPVHDLGPCFHYKQKDLARKTRFGQENLGLVCLWMLSFLIMKDDAFCPAVTASPKPLGSSQRASPDSSFLEILLTRQGWQAHVAAGRLGRFMLNHEWGLSKAYH